MFVYTHILCEKQANSLLTSQKTPKKTEREGSNCCHKASVQLLPVSEELLEVSFLPSGAPFPEAWLILSGEKVKGRDKEKGGKAVRGKEGLYKLQHSKMPSWK